MDFVVHVTNEETATIFVHILMFVRCLFVFCAVCPANWKPGSDTIVPDVKKSKSYFGKQ